MIRQCLADGKEQMDPGKMNKKKKKRYLNKGQTV